MISQSFIHPKNKSMQKKVYIGVDVSSATLDICVRQEGRPQSLVIKNEAKDTRAFLHPYARQLLVMGMENTGRYNWMPYDSLAGTKQQLYVMSLLTVKKA